MSETNRLATATADHPVWLKISCYSIGPDDAELSFAQRLARENGWTDDRAARVIDEYKRFCFLAVIGEIEMTPSDAVDQAWHLHLTYTRDYWDRFCPEVLGKPLHHGPTPGGNAARARYFDQYAETLKRYEEAFGEPPPADLWPKAAKRLLHDPQARRVHQRDGTFVPVTVQQILLVSVFTILIAHFAWW